MMGGEKKGESEPLFQKLHLRAEELDSWGRKYVGGLEAAFSSVRRELKSSIV